MDEARKIKISNVERKDIGERQTIESITANIESEPIKEAIEKLAQILRYRLIVEYKLYEISEEEKDEILRVFQKDRLVKMEIGDKYSIFEVGFVEIKDNKFMAHVALIDQNLIDKETLISKALEKSNNRG